MDTLPDRANLDHLRKQAKDLLRLFRAGDPGALAHFRRFLPAATGRTDAEVAGLDLRLHDSRSCVARQYGFPSWSELSLHVEVRILARGDRATAVRRWLDLAYGGDVTGIRCSSRHVAALLAAGADTQTRTPEGVGAYRLAMQAGLTGIAAMLDVAGAGEALTEDKAFVSACARADEAEARRIRAGRPDLPGSLPPDRLCLLPDTVAWARPGRCGSLSGSAGPWRRGAATGTRLAVGSLCRHDLSGC